jgi:hypothetical protein
VHHTFTMRAIAVVLLSVAVVCGSLTAAGQTPITANVRVSHDRYAAHAEPWLAVNPKNPRNLLGAAQLLADSRASAVVGTFTSFDGGRTWQDNGALPLPAGFTHGDDIYTAFTRGGVGLAVAEAYMSAGGSAILAWRTMDGGRHFSPPLVIYRGGFAGINTDHPSVAADTRSETFYVAWSYGRFILFSRSTNAGRTFSAARAIGGSAVTQPDVAEVGTGPHGAVAVAYLGDSAGTAFTIAASADGGASFTQRQGPAIAAGNADGAKVAVSTLEALAIDPRSGMLAAAAAVPNSHGYLAIRVWRSTDQGRAWGKPFWVDASPGAVRSDQFQPQLAFDAAGRLVASYFALLQGRVDLYLARADSGSFGAARRITSTSFDPALGVQGGKGGPWWIGDYQGLAIGGGTIYPFWNDTRSGHLEIYTAPLRITSSDAL